jgi:undecaprenyl-diphosphatase
MKNLYNKLKEETFRYSPSNSFKWSYPMLYFFIFGWILFIVTLNKSLNKSIFFDVFQFAYKNVILDDIMRFSAFLLWAVILIIALYWVYFKDRKRSIAILASFLFIGGIAFIVSRIWGHFLIDVRPYMEYHLKPLVPVSTGNGFPSDHVLLTATITSVMYLYNKNVGLLLLILTIFVTIGRVFVAAHHPLDVAGSILIVSFATLLFILLFSKLKIFTEKYL